MKETIAKHMNTIFTLTINQSIQTKFSTHTTQRIESSTSRVVRRQNTNNSHNTEHIQHLAHTLVQTQ